MASLKQHDKHLIDTLGIIELIKDVKIEAFNSNDSTVTAPWEFSAIHFSSFNAFEISEIQIYVARATTSRTSTSFFTETRPRLSD